jgi:hypothetical protein
VSRGPSAFRQRDLTRAVKAVEDAGVGVARVEIERGKIVIIPGKPGEVNGDASDVNPFEIEAERLRKTERGGT